MGKEELQKIIDDMKIRTFNFEKEVNAFKEGIVALESKLNELDNTNEIVNEEVIDQEQVNEVVETPTEEIVEAPVEENVEVVEENTEVVAEAPVEENTEVVAEAPVEENTEVVAEAPVEENTEVVEETPVEENTEVVVETPVEENTEVVAEAPVENTVEEVVVASTQLDDTPEEVEVPKVEDIPTPENPISDTPLIPNVENTVEVSVTNVDDKTVFKKEYDNPDRAILVNTIQLEKLKSSRGSQKILMEFGKKKEATDVVMPTASEGADPRAQMEAMMAQVEEARANNDMAKAEELLNKVREINNKQYAKV